VLAYRWSHNAPMTLPHDYKRAFQRTNGYSLRESPYEFAGWVGKCAQQLLIISSALAVGARPWSVPHLLYFGTGRFLSDSTAEWIADRIR
jgi:hypothetical protein